MSIIKRGQDIERFFKGRSFVHDSPGVRAERLKDGRVQIHARRGKARAAIPQVPPPPISTVLLWNLNCNPFGVNVSEVSAIYHAMPRVTRCDTSSEWTGNLSDYGLIIWLIPTSDPVWWPLIEDGSWRGRIHIAAEWPGFDPATLTYINSKRPLHDMAVRSDLIVGGGLCYSGHAVPSGHRLSAGMSVLVCAAGSAIGNGYTVFFSGDYPPADDYPIMQQNKRAGIDWVLCGDSNHLSDFCTGTATVNEQFLRNLLLPV